MKISKKIILIIVIIVVLVAALAFFLLKTQTGANILIKSSGTYTPLTTQEIENQVDQVHSLLKEHASTSQDVWQGYDLTKHNVIIIEVDDSTEEPINGWVVNSNSKRKLTSEEIKEISVPAIGGYNSLSFDGKESIVLSTSQSTLPFLNSVFTINYLYEVATHEMFHFYYDPIEKYQELGIESEERYTTFPKDATPRVYRKMVYDSLVAAYENPKEELQYLGQAKYWYDIWQSKFPGEYALAELTDIAEGKARYVQNMLCVNLAKQSEVAQRIQTMFIKEDKLFDGPSSESYELGFIAGVLLDKYNPNWKLEISQSNIRPVELLLKGVEPVKGDENAFILMLEKAEKETAKGNEKIKNKLSTIDAAQQDIGIAFLALNNKFSTGSYSTSDFISYNDNVICLDFSSTFENKGDKIKVNSLSVYDATSSESNSYILPLTMDYSVENGYLVFNDKSVQGKVKVREMKENDGRLVYIME